MRRLAFSLFLFIVCGKTAFSQQEGASNIEYIENRGQWEKQVLYKGEIPNGSFFIEKNGFTVLLHDAKEWDRFVNGHGSPRLDDTLGTSQRGKEARMHSHAYRMTFDGASEQVEVVPEKPLPTYNNYFIGKDPAKWATHCGIFQAITIKNVYPQIDLRYYSSEGRLKYDLIVHPGGDPRNIAMKYEGINHLEIRKHHLMIPTSVGVVQELEPTSFQFSPGGRKAVECKYFLDKENTVRFRVDNYSSDATLVIDPTLVFATFTGSTSSNWGFTATPGPGGTFFAGGIVFGDGFPVSKGAFEAAFNGGTFDVGIIKFSSNGVNRIFATYLGGGDNETPHSMFSDGAGNLVVLGRTYSADFPFQNTVGPGGGADMFVVKISPAGDALLGSLRIGGSKDDCVNVQDQFRSDHEVAESLIRNYGDDSRSEVILDPAGNIYVAASTQSPDFPVTAGAAQTAIAGNQDAVVLKIDPTCKTLLFATFLGGLENDAAFVIKLNPSNNNIYVGGATASSNFPGNTAGVIQTNYQGGICDGFVSILSNDGSKLIKTCFFGTPGGEALYGLQFDKLGFPYIMGTTSGNWPVTNNVGFINAGAKQFVAKLQPDLSAYIYCTTFGMPAPSPNISPVAFLVDRCENVYISGWGGWIFATKDPYGLSGTFGMPVSAGALKSITDGRDFYFIVLQKNAASMLYGTFYGQTDGAQSISEHVDGGTSRYDQFGIIYQAICANCGGRSITRFPTTPGVWAPVNGTTSNGIVRGCNLAAIKIAFNFAGVAAGLKATIDGRRDTSGCVPLLVTLQDTVLNAKKYSWSFGDNSPDTMTLAPSLTHLYTAVGTYLVRLVAIDSNTCNITDTAYIHIRVRADKASLAFVASKIPPCQSLTYAFDNISLAPPGKPFAPASFVWDFGDGSPQVPAPLGITNHAYVSVGTYISRLLLVDTNYCNYPDEIDDTLRIAPLVKAVIATPSVGCAPYLAQFDNQSLAGQQFIWYFGDGISSTATSPSHLYSSPNTYLVTLIAIDSSTCNIIDSTSVSIRVSGSPKASFVESAARNQPNTPAIFYNLSSAGATHYLWNFGDGDTVARFNADSVSHQYLQTGTYNVCLVAFNSDGCTDTVCHPVEATVNPLLDVPNAFTPGRFGQNALLKVQGFGITSLTFRVYNRWGQKVFETNNPDQGWDGTFNGAAQPMDVYAYTLEASFADGKRTTRRGDITLIR